MLKYYNRVYQFFFHGFCSKFSDQHFYIKSPVGCFSSTEATGALRDCDLDCHKYYYTYKCMVKINYDPESFQQSSYSPL